MSKALAFVLATFASMATLAQTTYDPKIAYTSFEKNADNIYVANSDGSRRVSVYNTPKARIGAIDMAPVDPLDPTIRKIAFTEAGILKLVRYKVLPTSITSLGTVTLDAVGAPYQGASSLDMSPDGSEILYVKRTPNANGTSPTDLYLIQVGGGNAKLLWTAGLSGAQQIQSVRWIGAGEFVFMIWSPSPARIDALQRATLNVNNDVDTTPETLFTDTDAFFTANYLFGIEDFDVARTRRSLVFTTGTPPSSSARTIVEYAMPDAGLPGAFSIRRSNSGGWKSHFSSDDSHILYLRVVRGSYTNFDAVYSFGTLDPTGTPTTLASRSLFGQVDSLP